MNKNTLVKLREMTAVIAIGPSTARNQGEDKVIGKARYFCGKKIELNKFVVRSEKEFVEVLDDYTGMLHRRIAKNEPKNCWGTARKIINVYLRDCCYNKYICKYYGLDNIEKYLEIPVDSYVAEFLDKVKEVGKTKWMGLKNLTNSLSDRGKYNIYQEKASIVAKQKGIMRVHLDIHLWMSGRKKRGNDKN